MNFNRPQLKNIIIQYSNKNSLSPRELALPDDIVIFLAGPTPSYPLAKVSWRDFFAQSLDNLIDSRIPNPILPYLMKNSLIRSGSFRPCHKLFF